MNMQILLNVDVLCTQGLHTSNWLISGNVERIFVILVFLLFSLGEIKDMRQWIPKVLFIGLPLLLTVINLSQN